MDRITFDSLPGIVAEMDRKLDEINRILCMLMGDKSIPVEEKGRLMTIEELREYLPEKPARQTVYQWKCDRKIPFEKFGKRLYFRNSSIDEWLANGRRM